MATNEKSILTIGGTDYNIKDAEARELLEALTAEVEYNRQEQNGVYKGRNLASVFAAEIGSTDPFAWLKNRAKAGDFSGLRNGDYLQCTTTAGTNIPAQTKNLRINGMDFYYQCGDTAIGHHIILTPDTPWLVQGTKASNSSYLQWNSTNNNNGTSSIKSPYMASKLRGWETEDLVPSLPSALQSALLDFRLLLPTRYSASGTLTDDTGWEWYSMAGVFSPSDTEYHGFNPWNDNGYSADMDAQLPLFQHGTGAILNGSRITRWSRSVPAGSSTDACYVRSSGDAGHGSCTYGWVRPFSCFLIG